VGLYAMGLVGFWSLPRRKGDQVSVSISVSDAVLSAVGCSGDIFYAYSSRKMYEDCRTRRCGSGSTPTRSRGMA
jgi:hypothetical protein